MVGIEEAAMSASEKESRPLPAAYWVIGIVIAGTIWLLLIIWLVSLLGFDPEGPIENIIGTRSPFVIALIGIPNALLIALSGEFVGKIIRSQIAKFRR